jgi:hypothetical protein
MNWPIFALALRASSIGKGIERMNLAATDCNLRVIACCQPARVHQHGMVSKDFLETSLWLNSYNFASNQETESGHFI